MDAKLSLVVLAAGSSTRYGVLKQTELFGPKKLTIAEYNLLSAISYGVNNVVFIIKEQTAGIFHERLSVILPTNCQFSLVYQSMEPELSKFCNRTKPWGTGHALLSAKRCIHENFAVMNADDLYGEDAIKILVDSLKNLPPTGSMFSAVGYRLSNTLSENGPVSRGIMDVDGNKLNKIVEHHGIEKKINENITDETGIILRGETLTSMNLWGFTTKIFDILEHEWQKFITNMLDPINDEFYLPYAVNSAIAANRCKVLILPTNNEWHGITYKRDKDILKNWLKNKKMFKFIEKNSDWGAFLRSLCLQIKF